jgi:hypothetical protein
MTESSDIIKEIADRCVNLVPLLPPSIYTFPLRSALILGPVTLACRMSFELGSRNHYLQTLVACFVGFLFLTLLPVEELSDWLHRVGNIPCTLGFVVSVLLMFSCPFLLPRWLVSRHEMQAKISKLIFRVLLILLIGNLSMTVLKKIIP